MRQRLRSRHRLRLRLGTLRQCFGKCLRQRLLLPLRLLRSRAVQAADAWPTGALLHPLERLHLDLIQLLLLLLRLRLLLLLLLLLLLQLLLLLRLLGLVLLHEEGGVIRSSLDGTRR